MELILTDGKVLNELANTDQSLWSKVKNWITDIISKIKKYYGELSGASKTAQVLRETMDSLDEVERLFTEAVQEAGERTRTAGVEAESKIDEKKKFSHISIDGKYYTPTDEEIVKNHPTIEPVRIEEAKYRAGITLTDEEYKKYKSDQTKEARKKFGVYTNKDTAYSGRYGEIRAEFGTQCVRKGRFYGGIAYFDILPHIPQIFEDAIVVDTKEDQNKDSHIKGIVDLVGCAYLGENYIAVVKMNVKEYVNNEAKLYDNRVLTIEELTVVGRESHLIEETTRGSTSPTVSSKYILSQYRDFVNKKFSISEKYSDEAYLSAVERGDMETAQKMVDEAADREILAMALEGAVQSEEYTRERRGRRSLRFLSYFNISNSVASSMTVTPSSLALVSLDPAASPATT